MNQFRVHRAAIAVVVVGLMSGLLGLTAAADPSLSVSDRAEIVNTDGDGVNIRVEPNVDAGIVSTLPEGWVVTIIDGPVDDFDGATWFDVTTDTDDGVVSGWIRAEFLTATTSDESTNDGAVTAVSVVAVVSADGDGLNLRTDPALSAEVLLAIPDGASVDVLVAGIEDADGLNWSQVRYDGTVGYSASAYLSDAGATAQAAADDASDAPQLTSGDPAVVNGTDGIGLSVRVDPSMDAPSLTGIGEGDSVQVVDGPSIDAGGDVWYQVDAAGIVGWVHGAYLVKDDSRSTTAVEAAAYDPGSELVSAAMQFLNTPYLWGGSTPDGFDCSGFSYFIVNGVMGNDFPRELEFQVLSGDYVSIDALQPGDLLFFENTYKPGLSHVGFYVGDGQFVSATGRLDMVGIQDLSDPYWSSRYLTARRVAG